MTLIRFGWCLALITLATACGGNNPEKSSSATTASAPAQWSV
jgi:hypothetical protein